MALRSKLYDEEEDFTAEEDPRAANFFPPSKPENVETAKKLIAEMQGKKAQTSARPDYGNVDALREARSQDELLNGAGRVSDALYSATTKTPLQFRDRGNSRAGQVMQEQGLETQARAQAEKAALKDPTHERNQRYRAYLMANPDTKAIFSQMPPEMFEQITQDDESIWDPAQWRTRAATVKPVDPLLAKKEAELDARIAKTNAQTAKLTTPKEDGDGKTLPVSALNELADMGVAKQMLTRLDTDFRALDQSGQWAKLKARAADTIGDQDGPAAQYLAKSRLAMQAVGKILEGGKLAAGDETKYQNLLPKAGDSMQVLQDKIVGMRQFLTDLSTGRIKLYAKGGYRTKGLEDDAAPQVATSTPKTLEDKPATMFMDGVKYELNPATGKYRKVTGG